MRETDSQKHTSYAYAIAYVKKEGKLRKNINQRRIKYFKNGIKFDHTSIKKLINAGRDF
ncbi:MAG: DDE-type integrase/transposase/recombinase [Piscirickettsiaceae bacterium]|nr:DDE-type integrase/transposase/recombinase [Piscirickettsiaceae bacterium]